MVFKTTLRVPKPNRVPKSNSTVTLTRLILEHIADLGEGLVGSFFPATYPQAKIWRKLLNLDSTYQFKRKTFSVIISRLQSEGLVARSKTIPKAWHLTSRGLQQLHEEQEREKVGLPPEDGIGRLVIFDIPEEERKKRYALRAELLASGFHPLQKSVWYGERPLPNTFIEFIDELNLAKCIHIFSVRERGTIR